MENNMNKVSKLVNALERKIIFLFSRTMYAFIAAVTLGVLALALLGLGYSFTPTLKGFEPNKPDIPEDPSVTKSDIEAMFGSDTSAQIYELTDNDENEYDYDSHDYVDDEEEDARVPELLKQIAVYFPTKGYPWDDKTKSVCNERSWYGDCYQWVKKTVKKGALNVLKSSLEKTYNEVEYLELILEGMPLLETETDRFSFISMASDLQVCYPASTKQVIVSSLYALGKVQQPTGNEPIAMTRLLGEQKSAFISSILEIKKMGSSADTFVKLVPDFTKLLTITTPSERSIINQFWQLYNTVPADRQEFHRSAFMKIIPELAEDKRVVGAKIYNIVYGNKLTDGQSKYRDELINYEMEINKIEQEYQTTESNKSEIQGTSLLFSMYALGGIGVLGLLLSLLAIERNTRQLEKLLDVLQKNAEQGSGGSSVSTDSKEKSATEAPQEEQSAT